MAKHDHDKGINWDEVREVQDRLTHKQSRRGVPTHRVYPVHTCLYCGKAIGEGAYSGRTGNMAKHLKACKANPEYKPKEPK